MARWLAVMMICCAVATELVGAAQLLTGGAAAGDKPKTDPKIDSCPPDC